PSRGFAGISVTVFCAMEILLSNHDIVQQTKLYRCVRLQNHLFHSPLKKFTIQGRVIAVCLKEGFQSNGKMVCFLDGAGFVFFSGTLKNEREQFIRILLPLIHRLIDFIGYSHMGRSTYGKLTVRRPLSSL